MDCQGSACSAPVLLTRVYLQTTLISGPMTDRLKVRSRITVTLYILKENMCSVSILSILCMIQPIFMSKHSQEIYLKTAVMQLHDCSTYHICRLGKDFYKNFRRTVLVTVADHRSVTWTLTPTHTPVLCVLCQMMSSQ